MKNKLQMQIWIESRINDFAHGPGGGSSRVAADEILEMIEQVLLHDKSLPNDKPWAAFAIDKSKESISLELEVAGPNDPYHEEGCDFCCHGTCRWGKR